MTDIFEQLQQWTVTQGIAEHWALIIRESVAVVFILLLAIIGFFITKKLLLKIIQIIASKTKSHWDDILIEKKVFRKLAYIAPALIINYLTPYFLGNYELLTNLVETATGIYMVIVVLRVFISLADSFHTIYETYEISKTKPIKGYIQVVKIIGYILSIMVVITILLGKNSLGWMTGFAVFSSVLMLVFKDPILGFVGGIQLSANNMVKIGDWISMPKYGADGTVIDISLTTVKVQNWDKTITTVPTYTMVTDYFQNWRGMEESGGRRIKRSINIDMNSIKFCTPEMLERFKKYQHVSEYVTETEKNMSEYNDKYKVDSSVIVNGRRQTNIGIFRAYLKGYLRRNPKVNGEMTFLVRQLQPTTSGLPMEVYVFSKIQAWAEYEDIQADIFDHILSVIPEFDLKVFQTPSGSDFGNLISQ